MVGGSECKGVGEGVGVFVEKVGDFVCSITTPQTSCLFLYPCINMLGTTTGEDCGFVWLGERLVSLTLVDPDSPSLDRGLATKGEPLPLVA